MSLCIQYRRSTSLSCHFRGYLTFFIAENSLITEPDSAAGDSEEILDEDDVLAVSY